MPKILKSPNFHCLVLGVLSVFSLTPWNFFPILFITFSYWFKSLNQAKTKKQGFLIGYYFGFGYFAFGLAWVGNALLIEATTFGWLYPLVLLASGSFFGLFYAFPAMLSVVYKNIYAKFIGFSAWLVLFEWLRSFFLTGFPWNPIGSSLGFSPITMQMASLVGVFGLSLIVLLITMSPALYLLTKNKKVIVFSTILILLVLGFGYFRINTYQDLRQSSTKIRLVQPAIPQTMKWNKEVLEDNFAQYINLSQTQGLEDIDFVIWGETATPFALEYEPDYLRQITQAIPKNGYLITGLLRYEFDENGRYQPLNSLVVINKKSQIMNWYDKSHLVPFGEYIPLRQYLPSFIRPIAAAIGNFKSGSGPKTIKLGDLPSFGASICYEIIFPAQNINKTHRPEFLINLTNDGWYGDSSGPHQHLLTAQMRALEEGLSVVRVANTGISALISPLGEVLAFIPLNISGILDINLPILSSIQTLYSFTGNYLIVILCLLLLGLAQLVKNKA